MIDVFAARCLWPGKHFEDRFHEGGRVSATFIPDGLSPDLERDKAFRCYVKAKPGSAKAEYLMGLKRRELVWLCYIYRGDKSYFDIALIRKPGAVSGLGFFRRMKERSRAAQPGAKQPEPSPERQASPAFPPIEAYES